jgi:hypothetical protein
MRAALIFQDIWLDKTRFQQLLFPQQAIVKRTHLLPYATVLLCCFYKSNNTITAFQLSKKSSKKSRYGEGYL